MVAAKSKLKVKVDIPKNWLIFHYSGQINKKQLNSLYTDVRFCVADLKPGFHVISDFSQCSLANLNCIPVLSKIMNYLIENKVAEVIRIIQEGSLIHTQLTNYSIRRQGYKPTYVRSFREAEIYLNNLKEKTRHE